MKQILRDENNKQEEKLRTKEIECYESKEEAEDVLKKYNCKPTELPLIFVNDPAILGLGVKPGDMIKITRISPTAGESFYYRYVVEV